MCSLYVFRLLVSLPLQGGIKTATIFCLFACMEILNRHVKILSFKVWLKPSYIYYEYPFNGRGMCSLGALVNNICVQPIFLPCTELLAKRC